MFEIADAIKSGDVRQIVAQGLGIIAFFIAVLSFQRKTQRGIMIMQVFSCFAFTVHFLILGKMGGFILNGIAFFRSMVYSFKRDHRWAASVVWVYVFIAAALLSGAYSIAFAEGISAILPALGMIITTFAGRMKKASSVRILTLINSPLWLSYNLIEGSIGGAMTEIVSICSIIIGILRLDIKKKTSAAEGGEALENVKTAKGDNDAQTETVLEEAAEQ